MINNNEQHPFATIQKGMKVIDKSNTEVGTVDHIYFGAAPELNDNHGTGAATAPKPEMPEPSLIEQAADSIFGTDRFPEEMRERLLNKGFIRVDSFGLFAGDRYFLPDQIDHIEGNEIYLNVHRVQSFEK